MIHILVLFDFSQIATHALKFATKLSATYSKLHIMLIHVVELPLNANVGTMGGGIDPLSDYQNQVYFRELIELRKKEMDQLKTKFLISKLPLGHPSSGRECYSRNFNCNRGKKARSFGDGFFRNLRIERVLDR